MPDQKKEKLTIVAGDGSGGATGYPSLAASLGLGGATFGSMIWTETDGGFVGRPPTKEEAEARYKALKGEPEPD